MPASTLTISLPGGFSFDLVFVEGGEFLMGDDNSEYNSDKPAHRVRLSDFYIGKLPVTQGLWQIVMVENPSSFKGDLRPVERVSWDDAQAFLQKLNALDEVKKHLRSLDPTPPLEPPQGFFQKLTRSLATPAVTSKMEFRLPTEAEWEFAARGGNLSQGYIFAGSDKLRQVGWHDKNSGNQTHDAGLLFPNELGIHDMSGNVWEWCNDRFDNKYYEHCKKLGVVENPPGDEKGAPRVYRGGSYFHDSLLCRPASRNGDSPGNRDDDLGFRLVLPFQSDG